MSWYDNNEWDDVFYISKEFLKNHKISELLTIVQKAIEYKEDLIDNEE